MGCRTFQSHHRTTLTRPLQELLTSCLSQRNGLTLSPPSPPNRRPTRNGSGIAPSAARASVRVKAVGRSAKTLVKIVVSSRSVKEGTVNDRTKRVQTRGRKVALCLCLPSSSLAVLLLVMLCLLCFDCLFIPCMYASPSLFGWLSCLFFFQFFVISPSI